VGREVGVGEYTQIFLTATILKSKKVYGAVAGRISPIAKPGQVYINPIGDITCELSTTKPLNQLQRKRAFNIDTRQCIKNFVIGKHL
jgi:hypothetical protein